MSFLQTCFEKAAKMSLIKKIYILISTELTQLYSFKKISFYVSSEREKERKNNYLLSPAENF